MWHHHQYRYEDRLFAKQLLYSVENSGKLVFPNFKTTWHFDDKVGQKYLLEAIGAPLVPSYVFYTKKEAVKWIEQTQFPTVFKTTGGSGSSNVRLIRSKRQALQLVKKAFGRGISARDKYNLLFNRLWKVERDKNFASLMSFLKGLVRLIIPTSFERMHGREKGYVYFQDFISGNSFDTRLVVVGNRCFGIRRYNRDNDFRASGSGLLKYEPELFSVRDISIAFDLAEKLKTQSVAYDFIYDETGKPFVVEISYGYNTSVYHNCRGYWDKDLIWHDLPVNPQYFIIEDLINALKKENET
jgi:glutathione synthase/RimK-type ligase-like ATP-grasp enzyme